MVCLEQNIPYYIHEKYNLKNTQVFQLEQNCSSTLMAINLAKALIESNSAKRVLSLSGNIITVLKLRLIGLFSVSDGVAAVEISSEEISSGNESWEVVDFLGQTDGSLLTIEDVCKFGLKLVDKGVELIIKILEKNKLDINRLSLIIPQNTNWSSWHLYCKKLGISIDKVYLENCGGYGHIGDVDSIRNLKDVTDKRKSLWFHVVQIN